MTSKEALQELFIRVAGCVDNEEYTTSRCREIVMKDLEVLEMIKRNYKINGFYELIPSFDNHEELDKIDEWLENENKSMTEYEQEARNNLTTYKGEDAWNVANCPDVYINCEKIILTQKGLSIKIDVTDDVSKYETIIINGVKFRKVENK